MADQLSSCAELEPFALQVLGDSMEPEFPDQCIVIIEPATQVRHGEYVMALVEGVRWFRQYLADDRGVEDSPSKLIFLAVAVAIAIAAGLFIVGVFNDAQSNVPDPVAPAP